MRIPQHTFVKLLKLLADKLEFYERRMEYNCPSDNLKFLHKMISDIESGKERLIIIDK